METEREWAQEFDEQFKYTRDGQWEHMLDAYDENDKLIGEKISRAYMVPDAIKSFIASAIAEARLEEREEETAYWRCAISHLTNVQRISVIATYQKLREMQQKLSAQSSPK